MREAKIEKVFRADGDCITDAICFPVTDGEEQTEMKHKNTFG